MSKAKTKPNKKIKHKLKLTSKKRFFEPKIFIPVIILVSLVGVFLLAQSNAASYTFIHAFDKLAGGTAVPVNINGKNYIYKKFTGSQRITTYISAQEMFRTPTGKAPIGTRKVCTHVKFSSPYTPEVDRTELVLRYRSNSRVNAQGRTVYFDKYTTASVLIKGSEENDTGFFCLNLSDYSSAWLGGVAELYCKDEFSNVLQPNCPSTMYVDTIYGKP